MCCAPDTAAAATTGFLRAKMGSSASSRSSSEASRSLTMASTSRGSTAVPRAMASISAARDSLISIWSSTARREKGTKHQHVSTRIDVQPVQGCLYFSTRCSRPTTLQPNHHSVISSLPLHRHAFSTSLPLGHMLSPSCTPALSVVSLLLNQPCQPPTWAVPPHPASAVQHPHAATPHSRPCTPCKLPHRPVLMLTWSAPSRSTVSHSPVSSSFTIFTPSFFSRLRGM